MNLYALFDPTKLPEGAIGYVRRKALVGKTYGKSRKEVRSRYPDLYPIPVGRLGVKERRWLEEVEEC